MSFCIVASCTPCVGPTAAGVDQIRREAASDTSSCCGHLVILMRRRSSATSASGKLTWNERIAVLSGMACSCGVWVEGDWAGVAAGEYTAIAGCGMACVGDQSVDVCVLLRARSIKIVGHEDPSHRTVPGNHADANF